MNKIITTPLSTKRKKEKGVTHSNIQSEIKGKIYPSIYIDSEKRISVADGFINVGDTKHSLVGKTLVEIVKFLRDNDVSADLTTALAASYPASMIQDFESTSTLAFDVTTSPFRLSEHHSKYVSNLLDLSEDSITRVVHDVTNTSFTRSEDLVFATQIGSQTTCLMTYSINKYFLFTGEENISNVYNIVDKHETMNPEIFQLVSAFNSENKDTLWRP
jgi:hypothetical protein